MDYILEELLRQRRTLAVLLTGGSPPETAEETERTAGAGNGAEGTAVFQERSALLRRETLRYPTEAEEEVPAALRPTSGSGAAREDWTWSALGESGPSRFASVLAERSGGTAQADAKAISRAIQRDARRYDGGFGGR